MSSVGLAARVGYALGSLVAVGAAAFYTTMWVLPRVLPTGDDDEGYAIFRLALGVSFALGASVGLLGLTLPWKRRRRRSGRGRRMAIASGIVVLASVAFASQDHRLILDLLIAAWLAYSLAFTYVRYGVRDVPSRHRAARIAK